MILEISSINDILMESLVGIVVVFSALTLLVLSFSTSGKLTQHTMKKRSEKSGVKKDPSSPALDAEKTAAISMALHLYFMSEESHDEESNVITIKRIQRRYSPWNSKIYGINNFQ